MATKYKIKEAIYFHLGFSTSSKTWLPVNPNYVTLNLQAELDAPTSHYKVYQKAVATRAFPSLQTGSLQTYPLSEQVFAFSRSDTFILNTLISISTF